MFVHILLFIIYYKNKTQKTHRIPILYKKNEYLKK